MHILIIGDSWGVPNYQGPPGDPPETHTEFLLRAQGHRVTNCAINASGNLRSILAADEQIRGDRVDWIVWFHTEMLRDSHIDQLDRRPFWIGELTEHIAQTVYTAFDQLQRNTRARSAVIGGQAPLLDSFYQLTSAAWVKPDWRSEILGQLLPPIHSLCTTQLIDSPLCRDSLEDRIRLVDQHKLILDAMAASSDFPDLCHPGRRPHRRLVEELTELWQRPIDLDPDR